MKKLPVKKELQDKQLFSFLDLMILIYSASKARYRLPLWYNASYRFIFPGACGQFAFYRYFLALIDKLLNNLSSFAPGDDVVL